MTETVTEAAAPAVITIDGPNDWIAAAAAHRVRYPHSAFGQHSREQLRLALRYLTHRVEGITPVEVTVCRAARILRAGLDAPGSERTLGIRLDDPVYDPAVAAAVIPVEPTAVIEPPRKRKPKAQATAEATTPADSEEAQPVSEEAAP